MQALTAMQAGEALSAMLAVLSLPILGVRLGSGELKSITIRNVPEEVHRRLRIRAAQNGRSLEAEMRAVLGALAFAGERRARAKAQRSNAEDTPLSLTAGDLAMAADEARRKVRDILESEGR